VTFNNLFFGGFPLFYVGSTVPPALPGIFSFVSLFPRLQFFFYQFIFWWLPAFFLQFIFCWLPAFLRWVNSATGTAGQFFVFVSLFPDQ
jgi:hypothetical protein